MKIFHLLPISLFLAVSAFAQPTWDQALPVLERVCWECHDDAVNEGEVDLYSFADEEEAMASHHLWEKVARLVENREMPPAGEKIQPSAEERAILLGWIDDGLDRVARKNPGDPGHVTMRRLTNTEYDNTIRDLTGLDLQLSQSFAQDAGGGEGFTNTGDVLFVSPEQLEKYLDAAREVASHASIFPGTGIDFREEPVSLRGVSTMALEINAKLRSWYFERLGPFLPEEFEEMRVSDYLLACWSHHHGKGALAELAEKEKLDPVFLENWWGFLTKDTSNPVFNTIRDPWHALPEPGNEAVLRQGISAIENILSIWMSQHDWVGEADRAEGEEWFHLCVSDMGDGAKGDIVQWSSLEVVVGEKEKAPLFDYLEEQIALRESGETKANQVELARLRATLALRGTHPDGESPESGFTVTAPSQLAIWLPAEVRKLRGSAKLWEEHPDSAFASVQAMVIAGSETIPALPGLIPGIRFKFADKSKVSGDFLRAHKSKSHKFPGSRASRMELTGHYMRRNYVPDGIYFLNSRQLGERLPEHEREMPTRFALDHRLFYMVSRNMMKNGDEERWDDALKGHLAEFAEQVYRRPLTQSELDTIGAYYDQAYSGIENREEAAREVIVRLLVSSPFLFKTEPPKSDEPETALDPWELASRLSYFLWASMPDEELRQAARDGSLLESDGLTVQVQRMIADPKSETLATEFAGQWLGFSDFREDTNIDPELFPEFDDALRKSMQGEITRFFAELIAQDRSVTDILHADYTYLDQRLADHYEIASFKPETGVTAFTRWQIDEPRGGILGMGAILAGTAFPDRASPVRRGDWILTTVLGYELPPIPADVPELENDGLVGKLPLRERLEKHRESANCRGCHSRIDPPGFALQNFDAIGRWRDMDSEGKRIDATATLINGESFAGPAGLKGHLASQQAAFLRQFCTKLLGYALGREVIITDRPLLENMEIDLAESGFRFSAAVRAIVESRQFQNRRNVDAPQRSPSSAEDF